MEKSTTTDPSSTSSSKGAAGDTPLLKRPVRDAMSTSPFCIHVNDCLDKALYLLVHNRISILPVINTAGNCVGVLTLADIVNTQNEMLAVCGKGKSTALADFQCETVMSDEFVSVDETDSLREATATILTHKIHHVPVLNREMRLVGVLSTVDLLRMQLEVIDQPGN